MHNNRSAAGFYFSFMLLNQQATKIESEIVINGQQEVEQISEKLNATFAQVETLSNLYYYDADIKNLIVGGNTEPLNQNELQIIFSKYKKWIK